MRISGQTQSFLRKTFAAQKTQNKQKLINKIKRILKAHSQV